MRRFLIASLALITSTTLGWADVPESAILSYHENWAVMMTRDDQNRFACMAFTANQLNDSLAITINERGHVDLFVSFGKPLSGWRPEQVIQSDLVLVLDRQRFALKGATVRADSILAVLNKDEALAILDKFARTQFATLFDATGSGSPLGAWPTNGARDAIRGQAQCYNRIYTS